MRSELQDLRLKWVAEYHGPNPCAPAAVVVAELMAAASPDVQQVREASLVLREQSSLAYPETDAAGDDGLLAMGQEAVRWALAALNEVRGHVLHAGAARTGDAVRVYLGFHTPELSRAALQQGLRALVHLLGRQFDQAALKAELDRLWQACRRHHPDYQARILMVGAREMDVPYMPFLPATKYWQFGWGANSRVFMETASNADGALAQEWQRNKLTSKALMQSMGLPTPAHVLVAREEELSAAIVRLGFPCVIKPLDSGGGKGVTAGINDMDTLRTAFAYARRYASSPLLMEQHVRGHDHRLMVIDGTLVAAIRREASFLIGDGRRTVLELLAELNQGRYENLTRSRYLRPIAVDEVLRQHLATQGLGLDDVPASGRRVTLRSNANRSTGGICTDVTDRIHPQLVAMAEQLALSTGLATAGLDYLTPDISRAPEEVGGAFIEMNATPGMSACVAAGWTEAAIARLVLGDRVADIPVSLRIVAQEALAEQLETLRALPLGDEEGWVCGTELRVGRARMGHEPKQPWENVRAALRNQRLRRLRIICTASEVRRYGLPLDRFEQVELLDTTLGDEWLTALDNAQRDCGRSRGV